MFSLTLSRLPICHINFFIISFISLYIFYTMRYIMTISIYWQIYLASHYNACKKKRDINSTTHQLIATINCNLIN